MFFRLRQTSHLINLFWRCRKVGPVPGLLPRGCGIGAECFPSTFASILRTACSTTTRYLGRKGSRQVLNMGKRDRHHHHQPFGLVYRARLPPNIERTKPLIVICDRGEYWSNQHRSQTVLTKNHTCGKMSRFVTSRFIFSAQTS
jgi:hypothetical protein